MKKEIFFCIISKEILKVFSAKKEEGRREMFKKAFAVCLLLAFGFIATAEAGFEGGSSLYAFKKYNTQYKTTTSEMNKKSTITLQQGQATQAQQLNSVKAAEVQNIQNVVRQPNAVVGAPRVSPAARLGASRQIQNNRGISGAAVRTAPAASRIAPVNNIIRNAPAAPVSGKASPVINRAPAAQRLSGTAAVRTAPSAPMMKAANNIGKNTLKATGMKASPAIKQAPAAQGNANVSKALTGVKTFTQRVASIFTKKLY